MSRTNQNRTPYFALLIFLLLCSTTVKGQALQETFGKNRIQYHDDFDDWWQYETDNFITHWYGKARQVGISAMQLAEYDYYDIQNILEHRINDKIEILVYTDQTDVKQSNLGESEAFNSQTGKTTVTGNKIFVYFDGDHLDLRRQIRQGIATVYLDAILFGSNLQEFVQNTVSLKVPVWYKEGLISFIGDEWDENIDSRLRELFLKTKKKKFDQLAARYPVEMGHAFWYYVSKVYGKSSLANILYLTRIHKTPKKAFLFILGIPFKQVASDCFEFYMQRYQNEINGFEPMPAGEGLKTKLKKYQHYTRAKWSPDGAYLAYITNDIGKTKIWLYNQATQKQTLLMTGGTRNNIQETDFNYPIICWEHSGHGLMVIYEARDVIKLSHFDLDRGERTDDLLSPDLMRIYDAAFWDKGHLVIAATKSGYSDLYMYNLRYRRADPILEDKYDDLEVTVQYTGDRQRLVWVSNRGIPNDTINPDSILPIRHMDIYAMTLTDDYQPLEMTRLTKTPNAEERQPVTDDQGNIYFLTNETGVINRKILKPDNSSYFLTNYSHNILIHDAVGSALVEVIDKEKKPGMYLLPIQTDPVKPAFTTYFSQRFPGNIRQGQEPFIPDEPEHYDTLRVAHDTKPYFFQSEFPDPPKNVFEKLDLNEPKLEAPEEEVKDEVPGYGDIVEFKYSRMVASRIKFRINRLTSNLDNDLLFNGLNTYAGTSTRGFEYPPVGILLKANIKDLFEDYVVEGGARYPTSFDGSEYFLIFDDKKRRIDKRYAFYRKSRYEDMPLQTGLNHRSHATTVIGLSQWSYPFDVYQSVRAIATLRMDKNSLLASDRASLETPDQTAQRLGLRLEYVFDNALDIDLNLRNGTMFKVYGEMVKKMDIALFKPWSFNFNQGFMTILGFEGRHYQRLDRQSIFASRLVGATSFGSEQILYFMGGVDNWLFAQYDENVPIPPSNKFAYNGLAAHMRGFKQNIRNGTSYILYNGELRVPVFKYLIPQYSSSGFFRNFQLTAFTDIGTAWHGRSPFDDDNPLNVLTVSNPLVTINVNYDRFPIIMGYGAGVRLYLLGYLIRADYAWGLENGVVNKPRLYLSFGADF
ncbi:MAG: hypothetical protein R2806_12135 [Saprospiraceae bacterium]